MYRMPGSVMQLISNANAWHMFSDTLATTRHRSHSTMWRLLITCSGVLLLCVRVFPLFPYATHCTVVCSRFVPALQLDNAIRPALQLDSASVSAPQNDFFLEGCNYCSSTFRGSASLDSSFTSSMRGWTGSDDPWKYRFKESSTGPECFRRVYSTTASSLRLKPVGTPRPWPKASLAWIMVASNFPLS